MHIQDLDEGNLTGTRGMVGPVVIDFRERTYRRDVQMGARERLDRRFAVIDETVHIFKVRYPPHAFHGTRSDRL